MGKWVRIFMCSNKYMATCNFNNILINNKTNNNMTKIISYLSGFFPLLAVLIFANADGVFSKSLGCLITLFLIGSVNWLIQYSMNKTTGNGIQRLIAFLAVITIGSLLSTLF